MEKAKIWKRKKTVPKLTMLLICALLMAPVDRYMTAEPMDDLAIMAELEKIEKEKQEMARIQKEQEWTLFVEALIWKESRGNSSCIGDSGKAVGVLQIWPVMVDEANRIQKDRRFTYDDRRTKDGSIAIFNTIQDKYNPSKSYKKALKIWNPGHGSSYERDIMRKLYDLKKKNGMV